MSNLTKREQFIILVDNEPLEKADAIVLLEGDGFSRIKKTKELFEQRWAPLIIISGGSDDSSYGSFPAQKMRKKLIEKGVQKECILLEEQSLNTKEQAKEVMKVAEEKKWKTIILVGSHYHQYRSFLTFLKVMGKTGKKIRIINAPADNLPWFKDEPWGKRFELLTKEFEKIEEYRKKGDIVSFADAINYQKWKEEQK